jgi:hypothetical protein
MKHTGSSLAVAVTLAAGSLQAQFDPQPLAFNPGKLAVLRVGDGSAALSSAAQPIFLDQFDPTGAGQSPSYTLAIPSTGADALTLSGTATSEGALSLSADGRFLTFAGYNTAAGTASVAGTASATVNRGAGRVDAFGNYILAARTDEGYTGNNVRGAVTVDGSGFWMSGTGSGTAGGIWYVQGTTDTQVYNTINNLRVPNIFGGDLYFSTSSGTTTRGIHAFTGLPTTSGATATQLFDAGSSSSPYDFAVSPSGTLIYLADDRATAAGGIQRWEFDGSVWNLSYTLGTGVANVGARGLTVDWSGATPVLFAITGETSANRLIRIEDTGAGAEPVTLATAGANTIFRGVDFTPVPEPGTLALILLGGGAWALRRRRSGSSRI